MGNMSALGMAGAVEEGQISLDMALGWHLRANHFPPVSLDFLPVAKRAIELVDAGTWHTVIEMPNGITKTAGDIVDGLHLHAFLAQDDEFEIGFTPDDDDA